MLEQETRFASPSAMKREPQGRCSRNDGSRVRAYHDLTTARAQIQDGRSKCGQQKHGPGIQLCNNALPAATPPSLAVALVIRIFGM